MHTVDFASPATYIDLDRYPILALDSPAGQALLRDARMQIADIGACELPDFIYPEAVARMCADTQALAPEAHRHAGVETAYLDIPDFDLPEDHPRRMLVEYSLGAVAYDLVPDASPLRLLYEWNPLMHFIGEVLERRPLYRYADPLGALSLAVMYDGDNLGWHFDQTDFVVSLALQDCDEGGDFEVVPRLRTPDDENYDEVRDALLGHAQNQLTLPMRPGTLLIFEGRYSLHRVSPIKGDTDRLVALLAYDTKSGTCASELLQMGRYGRVVRPASELV